MVLRCALILCAYMTCLVNSQKQIKLNDAIGDLSIRLLMATIEDDKNTIHSAFNIASGLGIPLLGAEGETFDSIRQVMGLSSMSYKDIQEAFQASIKQIRKLKSEPDNGYAIGSANRLFVDQKFPLDGSYQKKINDVFQAGAFNVDFKGDASKVEKDINSFMKNATWGIIPRFLVAPLPFNTKMALVNALAFKGAWTKEMKDVQLDKRFNDFDCSPASSATHLEAKWMQTHGRFKYADSEMLEAELLELPFIKNKNSNEEASMIIILPYENFKCNVSVWVEDHLTWPNLIEAVESMKDENVQVTMPQYKIEAKFIMPELLSAMGMEPAFSESANFKKMVKSKDANLRLSNFVHKAKMDVDKKGTFAAAATVAPVEPTAATANPTIMTVDRAFVALVVHHQKDGSPDLLFTSIVKRV